MKWNEEHHKTPRNRCWHIYVAEVIIFPVSLETSHFLLLPVGLPFPIHPSRLYEGRIKVILLSSKLQISFASVHLTLCFITVARGATRFSSPPSASNNSHQLLFHSLLLSSTLLLLLYSEVVGIIFMALPLLHSIVKTDREVGSSNQIDSVLIVAFSTLRGPE